MEFVEEVIIRPNFPEKSYLRNKIATPDTAITAPMMEDKDSFSL